MRRMTLSVRSAGKAIGAFALGAGFAAGLIVPDSMQAGAAEVPPAGSPIASTAPASNATARNAAATPAGLWAQVDEKTGRPQSLVRIAERGDGGYEGFVARIFAAPGEDPDPRCEGCPGDRNNRPVLGMRIISGLKRSGTATFDGGEIFDPDSGDTYRLKITVLDNGRRLDVRGYLGFALFGRSQVWVRQEAGSGP